MAEFTVAESQLDRKDSKRSITESPLDSVRQLPADSQAAHIQARPPIDYSSVDAFVKSTWARFLSIWTRRFCLALLAGQVVSLCITCTNVTTTELVQRNWILPTTQTWFL